MLNQIMIAGSINFFSKSSLQKRTQKIENFQFITEKFQTKIVFV